TKAAQVPPAQARTGLVKCHFVAALDALAEMRLDVHKRKRGRKQDAPLRGGPCNLADGEKRLARQRRRRIGIGAPAVGEQERAACASGLRDAVRIGERKQNAGGEFILRRAFHLAAPRRASLLPSSHSRSEWWGGVGGGGRFLFNRSAFTPHPNPPHRSQGLAGGGSAPVVLRLPGNHAFRIHARYLGPALRHGACVLGAARTIAA